MSLKLITAPGREPVSLDDALSHCKIEVSDDDALVLGWITAAREQAENLTARAFITQTWELSLDAFPSTIYLPRPPLQAVTWIKYIDSNGAQLTLATTEYKVDSVSEPARIVPAYGKVWPTIRPEINAVTVRFVCGYGEDSNAVPESIRNWMLLTVGSLSENRESLAVGELTALPSRFVDGLLDRYCVMQVF